MQIQHISSYLTDRSDQVTHTPVNSQRLTPKKSQQILCKIAFQIDEDEEQLLIYEGATLKTITDELIMKLSLANMLRYGGEVQIAKEEREALENEIKQKIEVIIESCIDKSPKTVKWKNKLKNFIQDRPEATIQRNYANEEGTLRNRSIPYFQYNPVDTKTFLTNDFSNNKSTEIIQRAKLWENSLEKKDLSSYNSTDISHRLYDEGRKKFVAKEGLCKLRQQSLQSQKLSQCTFQPNMFKPHIKNDRQKSQKNIYRQDVFNRLYKEAIEKQQKMKLIQRQIEEKQGEDFSKLNFIPSIDECSREITRIKRDISRGHNLAIYEDLYQKMFRKDKIQAKTQTYNFHPTLCQKSQRMVKKARQNSSQKQSTQQLYRSHNKSIVDFPAFSQKHLSKVSGQRSNFLNRYKYNKDSSIEKSPIPSKRKALDELSSNKNYSYRLKTSIENSQDKSLGKRIETCESQFILNESKKQNQQKERSFFSSFEKPRRVKKEKENIYFLISQYDKDSSMSIADKLLKSKKMKTALSTNNTTKGKKQLMSPYDFFQMQELQKQQQNHHKNTISQKNIIQTQMSQEAKTQLFEMIFQLFNKNFDDEITAEDIINSSEIPTHLKSVFYPMADEMRQLKVGLDKQEFIWSLMRIFEKLSLQQHQSFREWNNVLTERQ